jgi:hypothetical protein
MAPGRLEAREKEINEGRATFSSFDQVKEKTKDTNSKSTDI